MSARDVPAIISGRTIVARVVAAAVVTAITRWIGWPAPAVVGAAIGVLAVVGRSRVGLASPGRFALVATVLGWGALLARAALGDRAGAVVAMLGSLAGTDANRALGVAILLAAVTLGLGAALAWGAATLVAELLRAVPVSAPGRVTLSGTADVAPARRAERAPAAPTP